MKKVIVVLVAICLGIGMSSTCYSGSSTGRRFESVQEFKKVLHEFDKLNHKIYVELDKIDDLGGDTFAIRMQLVKINLELDNYGWLLRELSWAKNREEKLLIEDKLLLQEKKIEYEIERFGQLWK